MLSYKHDLDDGTHTALNRTFLQFSFFFLQLLSKYAPLALGRGLERSLVWVDVSWFSRNSRLHPYTAPIKKPP